MLNSAVAKSASQVLANNNTYLKKMVSTSLSHGARPFSVAFNVKSKFEDAFEKRMANL